MSNKKVVFQNLSSVRCPQCRMMLFQHRGDLDGFIRVICGKCNTENNLNFSSSRGVAFAKFVGRFRVQSRESLGALWDRHKDTVLELNSRGGE